MKVLQLIDSLSTGGAERMAITLANELMREGIDSHLCVSRKEGLLKESISAKVGYVFLGKKNALDLPTFKKLLRYVRQKKITVIHAHSTSYFWGAMVKRMIPSVRLVWHDHYGDSEHLSERRYGMLKRNAGRFDAVISVNEKLKQWAEQTLKCEEVHFVKNFVTDGSSVPAEIGLPGKAGGRIVCLANLRPQKDHFNLLRAFNKISAEVEEASLHLIGGHDNPGYIEELKAMLTDKTMKKVFFHGAQKGVQALLKEADIGVLSSRSEGLPIALLEYGMASLPVVCTNVGQCGEVVSTFGKIVPSGDSAALASEMKFYLNNPATALNDGRHFREHIERNYSFKAILPQLLEIYKGENR